MAAVAIAGREVAVTIAKVISITATIPAAAKTIV